MENWKNLPLTEIERQAIQDVAKILKEKYPIQRVIIFGSKARGDYDEHSDIDLLLISSRPLKWQEERTITEELFDIGMEFDVIFSPLFVSLAEWEGENFAEFSVYSEILRDGAIVQ